MGEQKWITAHSPSTTSISWGCRLPIRVGHLRCDICPSIYTSYGSKLYLKSAGISKLNSATPLRRQHTSSMRMQSGKLLKSQPLNQPTCNCLSQQNRQLGLCTTRLYGRTLPARGRAANGAAKNTLGVSNHLQQASVTPWPDYTNLGTVNIKSLQLAVSATAPFKTLAKIWEHNSFYNRFPTIS